VYERLVPIPKQERALANPWDVLCFLKPGYSRRYDAVGQWKNDDSTVRLGLLATNHRITVPDLDAFVCGTIDNGGAGFTNTITETSERESSLLQAGGGDAVDSFSSSQVSSSDDHDDVENINSSGYAVVLAGMKAFPNNSIIQYFGCEVAQRCCIMMDIGMPQAGAAHRQFLTQLGAKTVITGAMNSIPGEFVELPKRLGML
jgi:hypothetical protein